MAAELDNMIRKNAAGPESVFADGVQVKQHNLRDQTRLRQGSAGQVEGDRYLVGKVVWDPAAPRSPWPSGTRALPPAIRPSPPPRGCGWVRGFGWWGGWPALRPVGPSPEGVWGERACVRVVGKPASDSRPGWLMAAQARELPEWPQSWA